MATLATRALSWVSRLGATAADGVESWLIETYNDSDPREGALLKHRYVRGVGH